MLPIEKCLEMNRFVYAEFKKAIRPGVSEQALKDAFVGAIARGPYASKGYEYNLMAGARTSLIGEKEAPAHVVQAGDAILFDLMIEVDGYWSDTTRVFFCGEPGGEAIRMYNAVNEVLAKLESFIKPGCSGKEIRAFASKCFDEQGFAGMFPHHAGHQIAHAVCVEPDFTPDCEGKVEAGMTITLEPGIYLQDVVGIRLENDYLVTERGLVNLTPFSTDIKDYIVQAG